MAVALGGAYFVVMAVLYNFTSHQRVGHHTSMAAFALEVPPAILSVCVSGNSSEIVPRKARTHARESKIGAAERLCTMTRLVSTL